MRFFYQKRSSQETKIDKFCAKLHIYGCLLLHNILIPFIQKIILTSYAIEIIILWLYHIPGMDVANQEHDRRLKILNSINCIGEKVNAEDILDEFSMHNRRHCSGWQCRGNTSGYSNIVN
jgi:hypothetical protein